MRPPAVKTVASEEGGLFCPFVRRGAYVENGMKIGYVTDALGRPVSEARASAAGVVLYPCAVPSMKKGDTVANIGVVRRVSALSNLAALK